MIGPGQLTPDRSSVTPGRGKSASLMTKPRENQQLTEHTASVYVTDGLVRHEQPVAEVALATEAALLHRQRLLGTQLVQHDLGAGDHRIARAHRAQPAADVVQ